jgi:hypothetical protein
MMQKLGKFIRNQYDPLFPPKKRTFSDLKKKKKGKKHSTYKVSLVIYTNSLADGSCVQVWTASSQRDIDSAKSYILGSFPSHQAGDGNGDGDVVQLVLHPLFIYYAYSTHSNTSCRCAYRTRRRIGINHLPLTYVPGLHTIIGDTDHFGS